MGKATSVYVCQKCGFEHSRWSGQCLSCGEWNSLVETMVSTKKQGKGSPSTSLRAGIIQKLSEIKIQSGTQGRIQTGIGELDRVLGGGIVPGSVVLIAGEPGIGKSTLLTQLALKVSSQKTNSSKLQAVLYVCGEESPEQVKMRVDRLGNKLSMVSGRQVLLLSETNVDTIAASIEQERNELSLVIVDSVQTLSTDDLTGMAGSVGQIRESTQRLIRVAKQCGVAIFLVGHVTKEGSIAGPKVLEHMVDCVLDLTGERTGAFRILRTLKNRFGPTDEVGVFTMNDRGMNEVTNPSEAFLEESQSGVPGSAVVAVMEGTRPVLIEVQALVVASQLPVPRRVAHGVPINKVQLLAAVLQKRCRLSGLGTADIFANVAGGVVVREPAADLGIAMALASSLNGKSIPKKTVFIGEVGLLGEIRRVSFLEKRTSEAKKLGYTQVVSAQNFKSLAEVVRGLLL